jgi:hypothetical protein
VFLAFILLEVLGGRHAVGEGDGEGVEGGLPPHGPSCLPGALGVHAAGDQVPRLEGGLLGGEVTSGADGPAVAGYLTLVAGPVSGQTRSRCSAGRSPSGCPPA